MGIYVKFWHFLQCPLSKYGHVMRPKKQILKKIYPFLILHLILGKAAKFPIEKLFYFKSYKPKTSQGGGKHPPVLLGLMQFSVHPVIRDNTLSDSISLF